MTKKQEHNDCDMKGFLTFIILRLISKKSQCGEELRQEISKRRGTLPSPGTIYPVLKQLKTKGLITEIQQGKNKTYTITNKGQKVVNQATKTFTKLFADLKEEFQRQ